MQELRAGVIGLGVGERHLVAYNAVPGVTVKAICDIDPVRLQEVSARHDIPAAYLDYHDLIEDPEIDVISICSHDDSHVEQAVAAFRAGKHVMVEKPIALYREEAERLLRAQQDSGKRITTNVILRESPRFKEIRRLAQEGAFGDLFYLEGDYLHQILWKITEGWRGKMDFYCVTYGGGIHLIDLMRWILGAEVREVCGMGNKILTRGSHFPHPDTLTHLLKFDNDVMAKTTTTFGPQRPQMHRLNVFGSRMTFENDRPVGKIYHSDDPAAAPDIVDTPYLSMEKGDLLPDFIDAIRNDREPNVGAEDVFRVMDVCFACWQSIEQKRTVDVAYMM